MMMLEGKGDSIKNEIEQDKIDSMYEVACYNEKVTFRIHKCHDYERCHIMARAVEDHAGTCQ